MKSLQQHYLIAKQSISTLFFLTGAGVLVVIAYSFGVKGPFLLDDFHNLSGIAVFGGVDSTSDMLRYVFGVSGADFLRSISRLSFLLNDQYWPSGPHFFKVTNVGIHLINFLLFYLLLQRLTCQKELSLVPLMASVIWLCFPMHVSTTLYVVQRMTMLMVTFSLLCMLFYLISRASGGIKQLFFLILCAISAALAALAKENALVLFLLIPLLEVFLARRGDSSCFPLWVRIFVRLSPLIFISGFILAFAYSLPFFEGRSFSLTDRLMLQSEVLFLYLFKILTGVGAGHLFYSESIEHGDFVWYLLKIAFWVGHVFIIFCSYRGLIRGGFLGFGCLFFYMGHIIESTILPLELMFEHRNYLPSMGVAVVVSTMLIKIKLLFDKKFSSNWVGGLLISTYPLVQIILLVHLAAIWSDYRVFISRSAAEEPNSVRAQSSFVWMLYDNSLGKVALDTLSVMPQHNDNPALKLQKLVIECGLNEIEVDTLDTSALADARFNSGVLHNLEMILQGSDKDCYQVNITGGIHQLVRSISNMPGLIARPRYDARFQDTIGDYFIAELDYESALRARERAVELQPTVFTYLKLAELYILGGDLVRAAAALDKVVEIGGRNWFRDGDVENSVDELRLAITHLESAGDSLQ